MKIYKKFLVLFILSNATLSFGQGEPEPRALNSVIQPSESRGYICWNDYEGADQYMVTTYELDGDSVFNALTEEFTDKNYHRLDTRYLTDDSMYYSISAYSSGVLIEEGDRTPYAHDLYFPETECLRKCNGSTYAYGISYLTYTAPGATNRMRLHTTNNFTNDTTGVSTPFYQAVSAASYAAMVSSGHPYAEVNGSGPGGVIYAYKHVPILTSSPGGPVIGGPFIDANNNVVTDGWLIEKKMDQFSYMNGQSTSADPTISYCSETVGMTGVACWMDYFNAYMNPVDPANTPNSVLPFANTVPSELQCDDPNGYNGNTTPSGGFADLENWGFDDFFPCIIDAVTTDSVNLDPCFDDFTQPGVSVSGVLFQSLDHEVEDAHAVNGDGGFVLTGELEEGLYQVHIYTDSGGVISSVAEVVLPEEEEPTPISTSVDLTIAPNPITENRLIFTVLSGMDTEVTIRVSNLDGALVHESNEMLISGSEFRFDSEIDPGGYPYGQIIVTLTFPDGSTLQEIGLVE